MSASRPTPIFRDTSVLVTALESAIPHHRACAAFCERLKTEGARVVVSQIVRVEFAQAWYRLPANPYLKPETVRTYRLGPWDRHSTVREGWMTYGFRSLDRFLAGFSDLLEIPLSPPIITAIVPIMARYRLRSLDAVHAATAFFASVADIASVDEDFRRVPNLRLTPLHDAPTAATPAP